MVTFDGYFAAGEGPALQVENVGVIGYDDGDDGHLGLDGEVEGALFEWQ